MDLQKDLLESARKGQSKKRFRWTVTSVTAHAMLIAGIVYAGAHKIAPPAADEKPMRAFITEGAAPPPPPPPPPPPARSSGAPKQSTPKPVEIPKPMTSSVLTPPVEIPKEVTPVELPTPTQSLPDPGPAVEDPSGGSTADGPGDAVNGVEGGVQGGVAGGIVGGEVGGVQGGEIGGILGGQVGGTGTGTEGQGTGGAEAPSGPLRVGGNVKAPVALNRVEPKYNESARKAKIQGIVIVEAIIDKQGNVDNVRVIKGLPAGLSDAAIEAVKGWKFRPGTLNGEPVATIFNLTVTFKMD